MCRDEELKGIWSIDEDHEVCGDEENEVVSVETKKLKSKCRRDDGKRTVLFVNYKETR